jgi:hypothetical protein
MSYGTNLADAYRAMSASTRAAAEAISRRREIFFEPDIAPRDGTGWLRRQDSNLCISNQIHWFRSSPETLFEVARQPSIEMRMFEFPRPERRVLANADSGMQRFESCRPSQPVRL